MTVIITHYRYTGDNPGGSKIFHTRQGRTCDPPSLLHNGYMRASTRPLPYTHANKQTQIYVILIAFPRQWFRKSASMLRLRTLPLLFYFTRDIPVSNSKNDPFGHQSWKENGQRIQECSNRCKVTGGKEMHLNDIKPITEFLFTTYMLCFWFWGYEVT
jgi:hypothetical protein